MELTGADGEHQEVSMLALHKLHSALLHVNTLLLQRVLAEAEWRGSCPTSIGGCSPRSSGRSVLSLQCQHSGNVGRSPCVLGGLRYAYERAA